MAEDKKGFILYADQKELFEQLPDDIAGKLIKHIFKYVNDENPTSEEMIINIAFTPIKQQLKRDLKKFEEKKVSRSEAGKAGAKARWQTMANDGKRISSMAKMAVTVNDKVTVNVKDKENSNIYSENVFLSDVEYNSLLKKIGKEKTTEYIARLSRYMLSNNKKYYSHYNTLLTWIDKDEIVLLDKPFKIPD